MQSHAARLFSRKKANYKSRYGITYEEYIEMAYARGNLCDICKVNALDTPRGKLSVDHCHKNGRVKGLVCHNCNVGLGHLRESPKILLVSFFYLIKFRIKSRCSDLGQKLYSLLAVISWASFRAWSRIARRLKQISKS